MRTSIASLVFFVHLVLPAAFAQLISNTSLVGNVTDAAGASIAGAQVIASNQTTGESLNTITSTSGFYEFQFLKPGIYTITVQMSGFSTAATRDIQVSSNQTVRTNFILQIGSVDTKLEIVADIPPIKTDEASVNEILSSRQTVDLPAPSRNVMLLAITTAGVIPGRKNPAGNPGGGEGYIGAGTREIMNSISLDGVSIMNNLITTTTLRPNADAIQEVQIQTGTYPAQYGGYLGVQINMVTRSGGNQFHGALYEFLRNQKLDARPFFLRPGADKAPFRQNQFGLAVNGPVLLPKLYDGRNRTFFLFAYERLIARTAAPVVDSVLTPRMRNGDFSEQPVPILDPMNNRVPFPGQTIPASRLSPQSLRALNFMPAANAAGFIQNFNRNVANNNTTDQFMGRLDQSFGEKNRLFFRYVLNDTSLLNESSNPFNGYTQPVGDNNFVIGYTRVLSANNLNDFRFGRQKTTIDSLNFFTPGSLFPATAGSDLGIPGFTTDAKNPGLPNFSIANYMPIGGQNMASSNWFQSDWTYQISNTFSSFRGSHSLAFGFDSRRVRTDRTANNNPRGAFNFNSQLTGFGPSDFLLGLPQAITTPGPLVPGGAFQWRYGFFVQDKWQVSPRLTLTYGLRYELPIVPRSTTGNGRILNPQQTDFIPPQVPAVIPFHEGDFNNFAPRVGFAYRLTNKFVFRGGFGLYYNPNQLNTYTLATTNPPLSTIFTFNNLPVNPALSLANPIPAGGGTAAARPNAFHISPYLQNATMNQWSFSVERGLWRTAGFALEYLGSFSYHLDRNFFNNTPQPGPGNINDRRPNPRFGVIRTIQNDAVGRYNGLSATFRQNGFRGLTFLGSYTWSKMLDMSTDSNGGSNVMVPFNTRLDYGLANWDLTHRLTGSFNYEIPWLRSSPSMAARLLLAGWQVNGIFTAQSGLPFGAILAADIANVGQGTQRADFSGTPVRVDCGSGRLFRCVDINSFALPAQFTYGNTPRNFMRGPNLVNMDLSLFKNFLFTERYRLQFRWETFNSLNRPNFNNPNSTFVPGAVNFGNITSTATDMRQMQLALKLLF